MKGIPRYGFFCVLRRTWTSDCTHPACEQYGGKPFRLATHMFWEVVVSDTKLIDELRRAPDDQLSFNDGVNDVRISRDLVWKSLIELSYHYRDYNLTIRLEPPHAIYTMSQYFGRP